MQVYKEGIEKTIRESDWQRYKEMGFVQVGTIEEQPKQAEVEEVDDYTVKKTTAKQNAKPKNNK